MTWKRSKSRGGEGTITQDLSGTFFWHATDTNLRARSAQIGQAGQRLAVTTRTRRLIWHSTSSQRRTCSHPWSGGELRIGYFLADVDKVRLRSSALALKVLINARYCVHDISNNRQEKQSVRVQPLNVRVFFFSSVLLVLLAKTSYDASTQSTNHVAVRQPTERPALPSARSLRS